MAVMIKCKMCGGDLLLTEGSTIAECEYCGTQQTVPTMDDEKKLVQFERADRLRRNCEFDKAAGVYESIVADYRQEAEAYWGLVLCKYGIEYVDDPATGKKIPTCHRSSFESIMEDPNFEQVLENADVLARKVYREEAKVIEEIRKGIIEVSSKEDPYDIFICYKETAEDGQRTVDSVLAQDLYDALTDKGYRVFFSRITLEDRLGQEYEPYIFAALNSAKVMLAIGTDYEYFNAVWVKNEWSRYLKLMEKDKQKHLIPCFKGIDAYDMPKEFNKLQAQDLGKVGAVQDLLRGIDKLIAVKPAAAPAASGVQSDDINRIYIYNSAMEEMKSKKVKKSKAAVKKLESLGDWGDAPQQLAAAKKHLKRRKTARAIRRIIIWTIILGIIGTIGGLIMNEFKKSYDAGISYMEQGKYARAASKFDQAEFYPNAEEMNAEAKELASIADEKLRELDSEDGQPKFFFGDEWVDRAMEGDIREGEVMIDIGNSYNGYLEYANMTFTMEGDVGEITYLVDSDEFLFTSNNGDSQIIRFENGNLIMEDGRIYSGSGTAIKKLNDQIAVLVENADSETASEVMYTIVELVSSGFVGLDTSVMDAMVPLAANMNYDQASQMIGYMMELVGSGTVAMDESVFNVMSAFAERAEVLLENDQGEGINMLLDTVIYTMDMCHMSKAANGQAAYNTVENFLNIAERLIDYGYEECYDVAAATMEFYPMAEAGILGDDPAVIEQFAALYARAEEIINNW